MPGRRTSGRQRIGNASRRRHGVQHFQSVWCQLVRSTSRIGPGAHSVPALEVLHERVDRRLRDPQSEADIPRARGALALQVRQHCADPVRAERRRRHLGVTRSRRSLPMRRAQRRQPIQISVGRSAGFLDEARLAQRFRNRRSLAGMHLCRERDLRQRRCLGFRKCGQHAFLVLSEQRRRVVLERNHKGGVIGVGGPHEAACGQGNDQLVDPLARHAEQCGQFRASSRSMEQRKHSRRRWARDQRRSWRSAAFPHIGSNRYVCGLPTWGEMPGAIAVDCGKLQRGERPERNSGLPEVQCRSDGNKCLSLHTGAKSLQAGRFGHFQQDWF